jgi:hypothetical protein
MALSLRSDSATTWTTPIIEISWISTVRIMTTSEEEEAGVNAALQSHGAEGGDRDCKSHFLSLRYCCMTDYGSHRAPYSGIDALTVNWREEECLVLVFYVRADLSFLKSNGLILLQDSKKKIIKFYGECLFLPFSVLTWYVAPIFALFLPIRPSHAVSCHLFELLPLPFLLPSPG